MGIAVAQNGVVYFADSRNNLIPMIDTNETISTFAGNGNAGCKGDNDPATLAELNQPFTVAVSEANDVYVADTNNCIRMISSNWIITTVAENGVIGYSGDGEAATSASLNRPMGIGISSSGDIFFADSGNNRIRKISSGIITITGDGNAGYSGDGGPTIKAEINGPVGVAVAQTGNVYLVDPRNNHIWMISLNVIFSTVAVNGIQGYSGDGTVATNAELNNPWRVRVTPAE